MKFSIAIFTLLTAGFIHTAVALDCASGCAACWLDNNSNGVDTKFMCDGKDCGDKCPQGYSRIHCAEAKRCNCASRSERVPPDCPEFGPCACGSTAPAADQAFCNGSSCF